jgi:hypothetical protein
MTLLEIERLVRKISELLKQVGNPALAPKLAEDFAAACHAANLRLQQCEAMIKAGDRQQAIQLAETAPNLLDMVTVLEFSSSDNWRGYCQQNSLPAGDRVDARSVRALNECYAQGITTDHPLYTTYRDAVLGRNYDDALKALQSITRLNPADANAVSELARLDSKVLAARLQYLGDLMEQGDAALVVAEIEKIEAFGFKNQPGGDIWRKAQAIRCGRLLEEVAVLKNSSKWVDGLAKLDFIHKLQGDFKVELPAASAKQLDFLESWARVEQEKDKREREFQSLVRELHIRIHQSEEKDTSARYVRLPELRDDYEALHKVWRSLEGFTRPIPEEATASFRKRSVLLEGEIARRTTIRRRIIVASVVAVLAVGGSLVWLVNRQMKARDFAAQLQTAIAQRQPHTAERLIERVRTQYQGMLNSGRVNSSVADAETFVNRERALLGSFETAFAKLPQQLSGEPNSARLAELSGSLALARDALNALAPDIKAENEPRFQTFETQWQKFLAESSSVVNGSLGQWVTEAEKQCDQLDYRASLEKSTAQIATLSTLVQKIGECESGFTNYLALRGDLLQRSVSVRGKLTAYDRELGKVTQGMAALGRAHTTKDFSAGIALVASSEFSISSNVMAASAVQSLNPNEEAILRALLGVTNAGTWSYIQKARNSDFVPEAAMPAERTLLQELNNDPAVGNIHVHYRFQLDPGGATNVEWITAGVLDDKVGWKQIKACSPSAYSSSAVFTDHTYGFFEGQYRLSPTQPVYRLIDGGNLKETDCFYSSGLQKVLPGGDSYAKPMLKVLDAIKDSHEGSPLFRAWLFLRLNDLMRLQPDAWGLTFCPSAKMDEAQLKKILGDQLNSGDWFVEAKVISYGEKTDRFFTSTRSVSYVKQAAGLLALAQAVSRSGLAYVGFIGLDGKPNFIENPPSVELWGYNAAGQSPVLLAMKISKDNTSLREPAMPLSPLFVLASPRTDYFSHAGLSADDPCFRNVLPPLFQQMPSQSP